MAPMQLCSDNSNVIDPDADAAMFDEFIHWPDQVFSPSVTDVSMAFDSAPDSPPELTRSTTIENSEVASNAPSYDADKDVLMQDTGANGRDHAGRMHQRPGLDSTPLLYPVLTDKHRESTVTDRPATLPPTGGLLGPGTPAHGYSPRPIIPRPGSAITSWAHGSPPPPPEVPQGKAPRARTVRDPKKTAGVRAAKSCLRCSIQKVSCDVAGPCGACYKSDRDNHERVCVRPGKPDVILRSCGVSILDSRWTPDQGPHFAAFNKPSRMGEPILITVYFSPSVASDWQGLTIPVAKHADNTFRVLADCSAYEGDILKWAESQLANGTAGGFQRTLETFLSFYSQRGCAEKKSLVDSVVRMAALWRVISAGQLWCTGTGARQYDQRQPLRSSIVAELRNFAQHKMAKAEEKVVDEICALIKKAFNEDKSDSPAVWASLWTVILVYRQSLERAARNALAFKDGFADVTRPLLDAIIIILSELFRTRKLQDRVNSCCQASFRGNRDVETAFNSARVERHIMYDQLQNSRCYGDDLLDRHVVQREHEVMGRRKPKGAKQAVPLEFVGL